MSERVLKRYPALTPENWTCQVAWNAIRELSGELSKMLLGCEYPLHGLAFWDRKKEMAFVIYSGEIEELLEAMQMGREKDGD